MGRITKSAFTLGTAILMVASLSFAKSDHISVIYRSEIGKTTQLKPGTYRVRLLQMANKPELEFFNRNNKNVANVQVKIQAESQKNPYTEVDYNTLAKNQHDITAIRLGGVREEYVLPPPATSLTSQKTKTAATKSNS